MRNDYEADRVITREMPDPARLVQVGNFKEGPVDGPLICGYEELCLKITRPHGEMPINIHESVSHGIGKA